ncbi:hypothetical protein [Ferribacterium limneticum]|uniref:hypothetical protein n=1 Tax=Ferribacterium limneticum TaxID=76259 RepID=UPI001CF92787|nr:hypothetical protein [Ferribacterium limneticum]UCV26671.1 hypothetical protein KI617_10145 [Ferribacterium limneticum]UCV30588.1 hypothetical protein KI608_10145 [Ferribacterium limneticum]
MDNNKRVFSNAHHFPPVCVISGILLASSFRTLLREFWREPLTCTVSPNTHQTIGPSQQGKYRRMLVLLRHSGLIHHRIWRLAENTIHWMAGLAGGQRVSGQV